MLKCQLHIHVAGDPEHYHSYSAKDLIKKAKHLNYDVLAITCHDKVVFTKSLQNHAGKHGIILIPGAEMTIEKKHVLCINIDQKIENIHTFPALREYKKAHPDCLIIAPHPFFPGRTTLKEKLIEHIDLFDAIENSFCYTSTKNYNTKAIKLAEKYGKPVIATSDCHFLKDLDLGYTLIDSPKNISAIISAIKQNKIKIHHSPIGYFRIFKTMLMMWFSTILKKIKYKD